MDSSISIHGICFSDHEACGVSASQPGMEPAPLAFEGEVLTTGLPGKSPELFSESQFMCLNSRRDASEAWWVNELHLCSDTDAELPRWRAFPLTLFSLLGIGKAQP